MDEISNRDKAVRLLQKLGLKEYEAKSFVALSRLDRGTAKNISEASEIPRTRVYDAVRVLEEKGLVETRHSSPKVFRAVPVDEAVDTLRTEFVGRTDSLREALDGLEPIDEDVTSEVTNEVWAIAGDAGITSRTTQLIDGTSEEVVLVVGDGSVFTDRLADRLRTAMDRGVDVIVGAQTDEEHERFREQLGDGNVFVTELDWLRRSPLPDDETEISRLLLTDREAILVSSFVTADGNRRHEQAVFGRGFDNGLVAIVRRLMTTGLLLEYDPASDGRS